MLNDYLPFIIPASIGAAVGAIASIIVNYINYRNTTYKEYKTKFLKEQITELLQPLFVHFKTIESYYNTSKDMEWFMKEVLLEDTEIQEIAANKLYLASPKLCRLLLEFRINQYEYQFEYANIKDLYESLPNNFNKNYEELKNTVYEEFNEKVKLYQKNH